ncbi:diguanylate cyclase domain-containing protein [Bradyrhizobium sp.]|uniref:diguanylate cyclase domain-containing protein n=1 Tax=Bradyrhizobium sp. TaxID=376 RepID=UPI0023A6D35F|nr:diguanylate cyclase [Bradyrhizobium sp.]MDE1934357.1 diguanylate cyclase [Bradyrhizobium sp.]
MSSFGFKRKTIELRKLFGIRARLALLALILVAPLMLERAHSLEEARNKQIAQAYSEFSRIAQQSADTEREAISSVETVLKSTAHIQALKKASDPGCDTLSASLPVSLPWIRNLTIVSSDGRIKCATLDTLIGLDLSDRDYFQRTRQAHDLIFSDFLLSKYDNEPVVVAAYPVSAINPESDLFIVASINLEWMSKVINDLSDRRGIMAFLLDSAGTVMAAPADLTRLVGRPLNSVPALATAAARAINPEQRSGTFSFPAPDGAKLTLSFSSIPGTASRLILIVDEARVAAGINQEIRNAYIQLGLVCLIVLLGALIAAETLIIKPIHKLVAVARRVGDGEWSVRASDSRLPAEFAPLARAFDRMASQLSERERELIASNDHLAVMASIDMLSGLANRRGFQSRLEFEWAKAQQCHCELSLLMIDVDHFKLFNDTYGHPEGDACLSKIGETLSQVALEAAGFAARYGGEEFCLLLPDTHSSRAIEIGEMVRATVQDLAILHATSAYQAVTVSVGVASLRPNPALNPNDLLEAADASLYVAKRQGRNRVAEHGLARAGENRGAVALAG